MPEPSALQPLPFHLAMLVADTPPASVNRPPTNTSLPDTARLETELTSFGKLAEPVIPNPRALQPLPSHLAMFVATTPPAAVN